MEEINFILVLVSFLISAAFSFRACEPASLFFIADLPNERSLHSQLKPRSGGIGVIVAFFITAISLVAFGGTGSDMALLAPLGQGVALVALISFLDDLYELPAVIRLPVHLFAAAWMVSQMPLPGLGSELLTFGFFLLAVGWMTNLYNFMDGMDGFAAAMGIVGFGTLALLGYLASEPLFALLAAVVVAALLGFLLFNIPPSHLFLGDTGACVLGYLAAGFVLWAIDLGVLSIWGGALLFLPFVLDATVTLLGRISRMERVWEGERNHYYHWLLLRVGHRKALIAHLPLMLGCSVAVILGEGGTPLVQIGLTASLTLLFLIFYGWITWIHDRLPLLPEMKHPKKAPSQEVDGSSLQAAQQNALR